MSQPLHVQTCHSISLGTDNHFRKYVNIELDLLNRSGLVKQCLWSWNPLEHELGGVYCLYVYSWSDRADYEIVGSFHLSHQVDDTSWEVLFANTLTQTDSELFSSSDKGMCGMSLWIRSITPPPWRFLSFQNMLYGHVSGNNSEVAIELSIFVSWIATVWGLWTSRKVNKSIFFTPNTIYIQANEFQSTKRVCLIRAVWRNPVIVFLFFSFVSGSNLFWFTRYNWSSPTKKESEKLKNSHFGQIHIQPDFNTFSYSSSVMNEQSLWIHNSQPSHWTALWTLRTAPPHWPQLALQFVQYRSLLPV